MTVKQVYSYTQIRDKIFKAVDTIADPIRQTLSPRGGNVIYTDSMGIVGVTNDGVTIAKNLQVKDHVENAVIDIIRQASLRTNSAAGDATSTTVVLASILIKEGFRLIDAGWNGMDLKHEYDAFADAMVTELKKLSKKAKTDKDLYYVANISANNDHEIAENTVKTVKVTGQDGMVFIEPSHSAKTEIAEDSGFHVKSGMLMDELRTNDRAFTASYLDVPVLITDKRLYYQQEAETILSTALKNGFKEIVIVASDFIGDALPYLVANHVKGNVRVLLVKNPNKDNPTALHDLATYLGGKVVSDKTGSIVDNLSIEDFIMSRRVFADKGKTLFSREEESNKGLNGLIKVIRAEIKKLGDSEGTEMNELKERLASLTTGMVTIRVGGATPLEVNEKIFRYEDSVNATRAAMKDGYLVGGGLGMLNAYRLAFNKMNVKDELSKVYRKVAEANIRQIAENCGLSPDLVLDNVMAMPRNHETLTIGFNAKTMMYDDLLEVGVVDPFKAEEMAIRNAVSVAGIIISSRYFILEEQKENGTSKES